jgi:hypothetical protein
VTDQRELWNPITLTEEREGDQITAVIVERRHIEYVVVWETDTWSEDGIPKGPGPRWYIRLEEEDVPVLQRDIYAAIGEARLNEAEAKVTPKRRVGRKK